MGLLKSTSTVNYNGGAQSVDDVNYYNLTVSKASKPLVVTQISQTLVVSAGVLEISNSSHKLTVASTFKWWFY